MSTQNALLTILVEKIKNDTLVLPTLPAIALKVRKSADDPNINLNALADVIGQDPSLSARMIKISNSAYLGRQIKVKSVTQAVTRIGLAQVKNISTALAMEQLFVSKNALIKQYMSKMWAETIDVVANALAALMVHQKATGKRDLEVDTMTLTALIANIGALPVLTEAERHDSVFANPAFLEVAIEKLSGRIGGSIMRNWQFNDVFINCAEHWRNLEHQDEGVSYIDFVRIGAAMANQVENKDDFFEYAVKKGVISSIDELLSDEFIELRENAKTIFA